VLTTLSPLPSDAYVYIRFLRMLCRILLPIWLISWAVLFPVDAVNTQVAGKTKLERLTYGNVDPSNQNRLWAHLSLAWLFTSEPDKKQTGSLDDGMRRTLNTHLPIPQCGSCTIFE
jgi:hypothetical protein